MSEEKFSWQKFHKTPIIGILRGVPLDVIEDIVPIYLESGFYTLEITINSPDVYGTIENLARKHPELNVGAGTVSREEELIRAHNAGAQFIVMPVLNDDVIAMCVRNRIPVFPGAYTPTEINLAWQLGADAVKVFPASQLGPGYIREVLAPLSDIRLLPTGGVSAENIRSYFEAGAVGVGMGSALLDKKLIEQKDWNALKAHFLHIKNQIQSDFYP